MNGHPEARAKVKIILEKYMGVSAEPEDEVGETDLPEFNVELIEDAKHTKQEYAPLTQDKGMIEHSRLNGWNRESLSPAQVHGGVLWYQS